jgi:hypothetical protein
MAYSIKSCPDSSRTKRRRYVIPLISVLPPILPMHAPPRNAETRNHAPLSEGQCVCHNAKARMSGHLSSPETPSYGRRRPPWPWKSGAQVAGPSSTFVICFDKLEWGLAS